MEFLKQNPLFLLAIILVILAFLAKIISKPNKNKKAENKPAEAKTEKVEQIEQPETQEQIVQTETVQEEVKKEKKKLRRLKPEITKVFEKKELQPTDDSKNKILEEKSQKEEEILKSMQFVKSSKNVERLKPLTASEIEERERLRLEQELLAAQAEQEIDILEEKVDLKNKSTHFDRTRRLSKMIKEDSFDDMFCSHISEKYMNMDDLEKHLRNCDEYQTKLFNRVAETIVNSQIRMTNDANGNNNERNLHVDEFERRRREEVAKFLAEVNDSSNSLDEYDFDELIEDDVDLSARNILIVDAILKRKGKKNDIQ